jgi:NAD(P)-dependent dehydrogenase (short-subunit alcohol dehydrogenase family)
MPDACDLAPHGRTSRSGRRTSAGSRRGHLHAQGLVVAVGLDDDDDVESAAAQVERDEIDSHRLADQAANCDHGGGFACPPLPFASSAPRDSSAVHHRTTMPNTRQSPLAGQAALVTGGGRGIGRAIALALADAGAAVAVVARSRAEVEEAASAIVGRGGRAVGLAADVTERAGVEASAAEAEARLGPIGILVNNAGASGPSGPLWETDPDEWWRTIEVNLRGPMLFARAVLPSMIRRRSGTIVNVGSFAGIRATTGGGFGPYATSKAALVRFTDSLAASTGEHGVRVFTISPGLVHTAMTEAIDLFKSVPESEWSPPEAAAALVVRLAAHAGTALNGKFIHVNDDLDELLGKAERIEAEGLYTLRLLNLGGAVE